MDKVRTSKGWIVLDRSILDHWTWKIKPFGVGQAWVDLLLLATYKDKTELYRGTLVQRNRGEVSCSILWLADRWGWDRKKVTKYLDLFEADEMVTQDRTKTGTTIKIENYAFYQDVRTTNGTTEWTTYGTTYGQPMGQPMDIPNKVKPSNKGNQVTNTVSQKEKEIKTRARVEDRDPEEVLRSLRARRARLRGDD